MRAGLLCFGLFIALLWIWKRPDSPPPPDTNALWAKAEEFVLVDQLLVKLSTPDYQRPKYRGEMDQRELRLEEECAVFLVSMLNHSETKKIDVRSWGNESEMAPGVATLSDEFGNQYARRTPPHGRWSAGDPDGKLMGDTILTDVLVFEKPIPNAKELRMVLDGRNVGYPGRTLCLKLPAQDHPPAAAKKSAQ